MPSVLEQYRISDILEWDRNKKLKINYEFQRGSVWNPAARSYLINSILKEFPIPKFYFRTIVDVNSQQTVREVVDGQQRLKAILDFANNKLVLSKRAEEYAGMRYADLTGEEQERFLSYSLSVGQLINAPDKEVLEVFSRLNSYNVVLNSPEKRHAKYQGEFKWSVRRMSQEWSEIWEYWGVFSKRQRVRMLDDSLMAEFFGVFMEGVQDGGQGKIDKLYAKYDATYISNGEIEDKVQMVMNYFAVELSDQLENTPLMGVPHFYVLIAALSHKLIGIPQGELQEFDYLEVGKHRLADVGDTITNLVNIASIIESPEAPQGYERFWNASKTTTQRIASRRIRFPIYFTALS